MGDEVEQIKRALEPLVPAASLEDWVNFVLDLWIERDFSLEACIEGTKSIIRNYQI